MLKKYIAREPNAEVYVVSTSSEDGATVAADGMIHQDSDPELLSKGYHQREVVLDVKLGEELAED